MRPLSPAELYPAGVPGVATRIVALSTGVHVRVAESGPPGGKPVVMLHGWGASLYMFRHALALLPAFGIRAIAVDLRGYGLSDHPRTHGAYSLESYLGDLNALLDALGLERTALMGQSMGGGIALRYSLNKPSRVTRLVLINPVGLVPIGWVRVLRLVPRRVMEALGARAIPRWLIGFILRHIAYGDASLVTARDVDENWAPTQVKGFAHAVRDGITEFSWAPVSAGDAATLARESLVILGTQDRVVRNARAAAERLQGSRVLSMSGGHCVHEEHPAEVYEAVGEFLGRALP